MFQQDIEIKKIYSVPMPSGVPRQFTQEEVQEILHLYSIRKISAHNIATKFSTARPTIVKILNDHQIDVKDYRKKEKIDDLYMNDPIEGKMRKPISYADYLKKNGYRN